MKAYKGFNKDMTCRGFQFKEGETYETSEAKICECGFHACEAPLDVLMYYVPANSEYHEVELDGVSDERGEDTKICAKKIKIGKELSIAELVESQIEYKKVHCTNEHNVEPGEPAKAGDRGSATAGELGATTAGYLGSATAGKSGAATAGSHGSATAGSHGSAVAGDYGATAAGYRGVAVAGDRGEAVGSERGLAIAGDYGDATARRYGVAVSRGSASVDEDGVAVARGNGVRAKGSLGSVIIIVEEYDYCNDILEWKAGVIDGKTLKPNTWYKLENGEFVECE